MIVILRDILIELFGEKIIASLWITPLAFNFTINFAWLVIKNLFKSKSQQETAQEVGVESGRGTFLSIEVIFHLFSFLVTFFILVSINFYIDLNDLPQTHYSLWLPSVASIGLGRVARAISSLKQDEEETNLDKRQRQLSWYFILTIIAISCLWFYMIFSEELEPFIGTFLIINKLLL